MAIQEIINNKSGLNKEEVNSLCSLVFNTTFAQTAKLLHFKLGGDIKEPDWFVVFEDELKSPSGCTAHGQRISAFKEHLHGLSESKFGAYYDRMIGLSVPRKLTKDRLCSIFDTAFHEFIHYVQDNYWHEYPLKRSWNHSKWALDGISERMSFDYLHILHDPNFLSSFDLCPDDLKEHTRRRLLKSEDGCTPHIMAMYIMDCIANYEHRFNRGKNIMMGSITDNNFNPFKRIFNEAVGPFSDCMGEHHDSFRYLVNAPLAEIALYYLIGQKKKKVFNGRNIIDFVREAELMGCSAENVKIENGKLQTFHDYDMYTI